jgi:tRNA1(Val) A37 N6-methylase TrmN6
LQQSAQELLPLVQQAKLLAKQYDAVIANPPYMGGKGMNTALKDFAKKQFETVSQTYLPCLLNVVLNGVRTVALTAW